MGCASLILLVVVLGWVISWLILVSGVNIDSA
jgi:hypothetical protein